MSMKVEVEGEVEVVTDENDCTKNTEYYTRRRKK
jgi:hypothetical protein